MAGATMKAGEEMGLFTAVQDDVLDSPKLRKLAKSINVSRAEALGILVYIWKWGKQNADEDGKVLFAEREDIECVLYGVTSVPPRNAVEGLLENGWLEQIGDDFIIHDWAEWQKEWISYKKKMDWDRNRKQQKKAEKEEAEKKEEESPPTPAKPPKKKRADFVSMLDSEYEKLCSTYGKRFTEACIEELNNYKGSTGKKYKSDYLATLNWVVDKVSKKYPGLYRESKAEVEKDGENPFAEYGGA